MKKSFDEIIKDVEFLLSGYCREMRTGTNSYRIAALKERDPNYVYQPGDPLAQETLMEHIGSMPIFASYFHGLVEKPVNLGKSLEMLAIHDIGELLVGDKNIFIKKSEDDKKEIEAALTVLDEKSRAVYLEFEETETNEAKFAKSIDKIVPEFFDLLSDKDITIKRFKHFAHLDQSQIVDAIERVKSPYMQWDPFFKEFHEELIKRLRAVFG